MSKHIPREGIHFVEIVTPTQHEIDKYYEVTGEIESSVKTADSPATFKKAIIKASSNEETHPIDSEWMIGEIPPKKINFFGDKILAVQEIALWSRLIKN